jgi:hypothetical protein
MIATCVRSMFPDHDYALRLESTLADVHDVGKALQTDSCTAVIRPCVRSGSINGPAAVEIRLPL